MSPRRASDTSTAAGRQDARAASDSRSASVSSDEANGNNHDAYTHSSTGKSKHDQGRDKDKDFFKPRLSEQARRTNHIASEQKRRQAIRDAFDRLTELVPGIHGQGRSEGLVLKKTLETMYEALGERKRLIAEIEVLGGEVPEELRRDLERDET